MGVKKEKSKQFKTAIIGLGYWGPNYARIFNELETTELYYCCDLEEKNLERIKNLYPRVKTTRDYNEIAKNPEIDAIVITTPLNTHYQIAKCFLENKKHVLVEKPFTSNSKEGRVLMKIAAKNGLVLMVGHVFEYNPGIIALRKLIREGELGKLHYLSAERVGLGPIRKHASALWDLATHDISIALYLLGGLPKEVTAEGACYIQKKVDDIVILSLRFANGVLCNILASWIAPEKIRKITVVGSKGMAIFDDVNKSEVLKIYEREIDGSLLNSTPDYIDHQAIINIGDIRIPRIKDSEPLKNQVEHFLECIVENKQPMTDAQDGINVIKVLEAAEKSLKSKSKRKVKCR